MKTNDEQEKLTFKEAEVILDLAAQLSVNKARLDETLSLEELFEIAQEADISVESIQQALDKYAQEKSASISEFSRNEGREQQLISISRGMTINHKLESTDKNVYLIQKERILSIIQGCFSFIVALIAFKTVFPYTKNLGIDILTKSLNAPNINPEFIFAPPFELLRAIALSSAYLITVIIFSNFLLLASYIATKISFILLKFIYLQMMPENNHSQLLD